YSLAETVYDVHQATIQYTETKVEDKTLSGMCVIIDEGCLDIALLSKAEITISQLQVTYTGNGGKVVGVLLTRTGKLYAYAGIAIGAVESGWSVRFGKIIVPAHPTDWQVSNFPSGWSKSVSQGNVIATSSSGMTALEFTPDGFLQDRFPFLSESIT